jgi:carbon-monoxide dehydrogenase iron sulfur subunit
MAKMIVISEQYCLGCKTCVIECAMAHSDVASLAQAAQSATPPQARVHVDGLNPGAMPLQCRHCEDAPCMMACPTDALDRATPQSPVVLDADLCIGCRICMMVCPFGVIELSRNGKVATKCDLCASRTQKGEEPACVAGCATGALTYQDVDDFLLHRRQEAGKKIAAGSGRARDIAEGKDDR